MTPEDAIAQGRQTAITNAAADAADDVAASSTDTTRNINGRLDFKNTDFDINNPPIRFTDTELDNSPSAKGNIMEWGGDMVGQSSHVVGIATNAYRTWNAGGQVGSRPTFTAPGTANTSFYRKWAWFLAHYNSPANTGEDVHQHLNLETVKADWQTVITRIQVSFGENTALVSFPNSDVKIYNDKDFVIGADASGTIIRHDTAAGEIKVTSLASTPWSFTDTTIIARPTVSSNTILASKVGAEAIYRFTSNGSGRLEWGTGSASRDTQLYRNGVGQLRTDSVFMPQQAPTASAPTYVKGGMYFDTTLNKLRVGGASGWETVTSS